MSAVIRQTIRKGDKAHMKAVSFFALSLAFCLFGCWEHEAEKTSPVRDEIVGAAKDTLPTPKTTASKPTVPQEKTRPSGGKPVPYAIRPGCAAFSPDGK